jgi:hypothetical protein
MLTLRIGGVPAQALGYGAVGDLEIKQRWSSTGGGMDVVSFKLACPRGYTHPALRQGSLVEVLRGPYRLGSAILADPDREGWTFVADGLFRRAEHFVAQASGGAASTVPSVVVSEANLRGLGWNGIGNLPTTAVATASSDTAQLNTVADVLSEYCRLNGKRWGLDANSVPYVADDPTIPTLALTPGTPKMATADDDYASRVTVRYVSAVAGTPPEPSGWAQASATSTLTPHGPRETTEDITNLGLLSSGAAGTYAATVLAAQSARPAFTEALDVAAYQVTTIGGTPPSRWAPLHGQMVRHFGVLDSDGQAAYGSTLQWVVGSTTYRPGDDSLILAPTDMAARTVAQVQQANVVATSGGFS